MSIYNCSPACHRSYSLYLYPVPLSPDSRWLMGLIYIWTRFPPFSPLLEVPPSEWSGVAAARHRGHEMAPGPLLRLLDPFSGHHRGLHRVQKCTGTPRDQRCHEPWHGTGQEGEPPTLSEHQRYLNLQPRLPNYCLLLLLGNNRRK